jgi:hypothetical protein
MDLNAKQFGHLFLAEPKGLVLKEDFYMHRTARCSVENYIAFFWCQFLAHSDVAIASNEAFNYL